MTEEQANQVLDALARMATALENIGRLVEEQRKPAPRAASVSSIPRVSPPRRPTPA